MTAEVVLHPIIELTMVAVFCFDAERNRHAGAWGTAANMSYWFMALALLTACCLYLANLLPDFQLIALIVGAVLFPAFVVCECIATSRPRHYGEDRSERSLRQDLQWTIPALVISLWVFAGCLRAGGLDWYVALFAAVVAVASVAGLVKLVRKVY